MNHRRKSNSRVLQSEVLFLCAFAIPRLGIPRLSPGVESASSRPWQPAFVLGTHKRWPQANEASRVSSSGRSRCWGEPPAPAGRGSTEHFFLLQTWLTCRRFYQIGWWTRDRARKKIY